MSRPKTGGPRAHIMDYPSLNLGYPAVSCKTVSLADLEVYVHGLEEISDSSLPISVVIATHGRCNSAKNMVPMAHGLVGEINALATATGSGGNGRKQTHDLLVVTLDQRNHGTRLKNPKANLAYDENPTHLVDMTAVVYGGCQDTSLIIDFLAAYLFPLGERVIDQFMITGISLGGNVSWRLLGQDPRIKIGVPIIGLPFTAFARYLGARAESMGINFGPPTYPPALRGLLEAGSPSDTSGYKGKKILSIHGKLDELVPYIQGKTDIDNVVHAAPKDEVRVFVQEDRGHVCTPEMVRLAAEWFWRWGLSADGDGQDVPEVVEATTRLKL